jgi:mono/diheme cytochrome c family protein
MARCRVTDLRRLTAALLAAAAVPVAAQTSSDPTRGALLNATHCVACHQSG